MKRLVAILALLLPAAAAQATWYSENVADGADIIMMDLRWPWWPSGTYYANWNSSFNPKPNNLTFYAGFTSFAPDGPNETPNTDERVQSSFRPGSVWTFWGADSQGTPVRFTDVAPNLFIRNDYGGEGSSGTMGGEVWPFIQSRQWYTMAARVWQPIGEHGPPHAYIGRWIKDQAAGRWHLIGVARLPIAATSFTGNSGFIEPLTSERAVRSLHRRLGYYRKDGRWQKSDTISIDKTVYVVVNKAPEGDHEYAAIEYSQRPDQIPQRLVGPVLSGDRIHSFTVRQPELPSLDRPAVADVRAETTGRQLAVSWSVPKTSSPAFSYRIEVFDNSRCTGPARIVLAGRMPSMRRVLIDAELKSPTVRLTVGDIFDQTAPPVIVSAAACKPPSSAVHIPATRPGLTYSLLFHDATRRVNYFNPPLQDPNERHYWLNLREIEQGRAVRSGLARGFDLSVREQRDTGYALRYTGYLRAPKQGIYLLHTQIDGAFRICVDGRDLLEWDGQHGTTERSAALHLAKGDHPLSVTYLYDDLPAHNFAIEWDGPGFSRRPISLDSLRVPNDGAFPTPMLEARSLGDGTARVVIHTDARGHRVNRTALFLGPLQLAESNGPVLNYLGPLPSGSNLLWCRVQFDDARSVDSDPTLLTITGRPIAAEWAVRNVGDAKASAGLWQTGAGAFQFFGNGMHTISKRITGDFTATCRIDGYNGSHGEPVNPHAWVGLAALEHGERLNWDWGQYFYLVQTAADGLRAAADFSDLGAGRISSYELPKGRPWIRIVRQGNVWTGWSSTDGKQWEPGAYQFRKASPQMDVGLFFSALPQEARAHYQARVSQLTIEGGVASETATPLPIAARNTGGERLTGVVVSRSQPQVVVVRSSAFGLIRTADAGKTWTPANGELTGEDLSVRSVAIHPTDPLTMLRACGRGPHGRIWKTTDGGRSWARLDFDGDFDGVGPSALCGEVVAYDLLDPKTVYVGCESKGFYKSADGGTTWTRIGLGGERITSVIVWPWEKYHPGVGKGKTHLCVTTSADRWMTYLGRGVPAVATSSALSRSYVESDDAKSLSVVDERGDTGFFNVAYDKATQTTRVMGYATAHGFQHNSGGLNSLFPEQTHLEWLRPFTAVADASIGAGKWGRFIAQALDPAVPGRLSRSEQWAEEWNWLPIKGDVPPGGLIAAAGEVDQGDRWWFVFSDGLYSSPDGGATLRKVMDAKRLAPVN